MMDIFDWSYKFGPFTVHKWSGYTIPDLRERNIDVWKYYSDNGCSGIGLILNFRKRYIGFSVLWEEEDECNEI